MDVFDFELETEDMAKEWWLIYKHMSHIIWLIWYDSREGELRNTIMTSPFEVDRIEWPT